VKAFKFWRGQIHTCNIVHTCFFFICSINLKHQKMPTKEKANTKEKTLNKTAAARFYPVASYLSSNNHESTQSLKTMLPLTWSQNSMYVLLEFHGPNSFHICSTTLPAEFTNQEQKLQNPIHRRKPAFISFTHCLTSVNLIAFFFYFNKAS